MRVYDVMFVMCGTIATVGSIIWLPCLAEMASSSSNSPCAACKFLRRKCTAECVFAPYFPPDQPHKFASVHKIFGASNITKLLNELQPHQREDAVNSLAYEAEARMKDPVYGCVGAISVLQRQVQQLQRELAAAHADLARYAGSTSSQLSGMMSMSLSPHSTRDHRPHIMQPPQFTREQLLEFARVGGSYEAGLAALGMAASLNVPYAPSTTASDGASGSSGGGPSMGHLSPP